VTRRRAAEDRKISEDDDGVLDEHAVGLFIGRIDLNDLPSAGAEDVDVRLPLTLGEIGSTEVLPMWVTSPSARRGEGRRTSRRDMARP
jgi:hypothetical protein